MNLVYEIHQHSLSPTCSFNELLIEVKLMGVGQVKSVAFRSGGIGENLHQYATMHILTVHWLFKGHVYPLGEHSDIQIHMPSSMPFYSFKLVGKESMALYTDLHVTKYGRETLDALDR
jgi:hypothetical protein